MRTETRRRGAAWAGGGTSSSLQRLDPGVPLRRGPWPAFLSFSGAGTSRHLVARQRFLLVHDGFLPGGHRRSSRRVDDARPDVLNGNSHAEIAIAGHRRDGHRPDAGVVDLARNRRSNRARTSETDRAVGPEMARHPGAGPRIGTATLLNSPQTSFRMHAAPLASSLQPRKAAAATWTVGTFRGRCGWPWKGPSNGRAEEAAEGPKGRQAAQTSEERRQGLPVTRAVARPFGVRPAPSRARRRRSRARAVPLARRPGPR